MAILWEVGKKPTSKPQSCQQHQQMVQSTIMMKVHSMLSKNKTQSFFPNLAGVTAQAKYKNKSLQELHVKITTQFYSETEIRSFTQFVSQMAKTYLPGDIPIDITIKGSDGEVQAFLAREKDSGSFYTHVFDD